MQWTGHVLLLHVSGMHVATLSLASNVTPWKKFGPHYVLSRRAQICKLPVSEDEKQLDGSS
jgi:hypothetical protein